MKKMVIFFAMVLGALNLLAQTPNQIIVGTTPCLNCNGYGGTFHPYFGPSPCQFCRGRGWFPIYGNASNCVPGGLTFYNKHYTATSTYVSVSSETGAKKGNFRVFISDGKCYIQFPKGTKNYVKLGNGTFSYGANLYYFE